MITRVDERLRSEARAFRLCFTCEHCAHFAPETKACGNGYPTEPHRDVSLDHDSVTFCKQFELA